MLREFYPLFLSLTFAMISIFAKLLSRREKDISPHRNDLCAGQSLLLGAISAALVFTGNALVALQKDGEAIDKNMASRAMVCIAIAAICILLLFVLAYVDRYLAWEVQGKIAQRSFLWGLLIPNCVGLISFVSVFIYTMPGR